MEIVPTPDASILHIYAPSQLPYNEKPANCPERSIFIEHFLFFYRLPILPLRAAYEIYHLSLLPAGAVIVLKQWYDNTANNPNNPDPDMWVMGGSRTGDEMTHAWLAITHLDDEGYEKLKEERNEKINIAVR